MSAKPMLYNRKPADNFEAMQFTGDNVAAVEAWMRSRGGKSCPALEHPSTARLLIIQTPDGSREVRVGDYIARIGSDFYLLPEHIFVETYEPVSVVPAEDQSKPRAEHVHTEACEHRLVSSEVAGVSECYSCGPGVRDQYCPNACPVVLSEVLADSEQVTR